MEKLEEIVWNDMAYQEELVEAYQSEAVYRDSQILVCCTVLAGAAGKISGEILYRRKWLLDIGLATLLRMAERQQKMKYPISFDFYPVNQDKKDIAAAGAITIMLYALYEKNYADAEKVLRLLEWNQSFLYRYPVYKDWMLRIREILQQMEKKTRGSQTTERFSLSWKQQMEGVCDVQEPPKADASAWIFRVSGNLDSGVKKQDVQCAFDSCTMQYRQLIRRIE